MSFHIFAYIFICNMYLISLQFSFVYQCDEHLVYSSKILMKYIKKNRCVVCLEYLLEVVSSPITITNIFNCHCSQFILYHIFLNRLRGSVTYFAQDLILFIFHFSVIQYIFQLFLIYKTKNFTKKMRVV